MDWKKQLEQIISDAQQALLALEDEHEGDFKLYVGEVSNRAFSLNCQVGMS